MDERYIVSVVQGFLLSAAKELAAWLEKMLPGVTDEWWTECVILNLSYEQQIRVQESGLTQLNQLDLAALLRIAEKSWYDMRSFASLPSSDRECIRSMRKVRNHWAQHIGSLEKDFVLSDLDTILMFFESVIGTQSYSKEIRSLIEAIKNTSFSAANVNSAVDGTSMQPQMDTQETAANEIHEKDHVFMSCCKMRRMRKLQPFALSSTMTALKYFTTEGRSPIRIL